ncbi:LLM class flavin-dependent oxidoreductase [Paenibacillus sp. y28]|uniref:LLM class flavin-dependent oxidoreductase n=1 Tax=Paenibacillus sp. y28 TaxID=3129110 RepID=UPI003016C0FB
MLPEGDTDRIVRQTRLAEEYGFNAVLVINANEYMDPWIVATILAGQTERLRILVAQNTSYTLPTTMAKAQQTLNLLTGGRVDVNIVTGSSAIEMGKMAKTAEHSLRYRRTKEFLTLYSRLLQGITNFQGEFFEVQNADLHPKTDTRGSVFLAGSSLDAMEAAAAHADYYLVFGHEFETIRGQFTEFQGLVSSQRARPKCGIMIDVIARETSEAAWAAAHRYAEQTSPFQKRMNRLFRNNCDSVGMNRYHDYYKGIAQPESSTLWGGLSQLNTSNGMSIVGSYEEVRDTLLRYHELGTHYFILSGLAGPEEMKHIGEHVLPLVETDRAQVC